MGIGKAFAIVGGLLVGAVGAYNYSTTGCPLGGACDTDQAEADTAITTTVASAATEEPGCPLCAGAEQDAKADCDPANCDKTDCDPSQCPHAAQQAQCPQAAAQAEETAPSCCEKETQQDAPAAPEDG